MIAPLFERNARVAFIGDSITHTSPLSSYVQEYYWRHLPSHRVKVFNLGIGGDTAEGTLGRLEADVMRARPTEAVIMLGTNDINYHLYKEAPTEAERAAAEENARRHLAAMRSLVEYLHSHAIPVTLCSSIGRDELTPPRDTPIDGAQRSYGATARLRALFDENCRALAGMLKGTVDYMTPFQALQAATLAVGAPSLFTIDRIHASPLGQRLMARIFLAAQGLPVALPTAEMLAAGWQEAPLTPAIAERFGVEQILRNIRWVDPHQADKTEGLDLEGRIAYWTRAVEERRGLAQYDWAVSLYRVYLENARNEEALVARLEALTDALYE
jgi:lysophospholipase L1-like esterase